MADEQKTLNLKAAAEEKAAQQNAPVNPEATQAIIADDVYSAAAEATKETGKAAVEAQPKGSLKRKWAESLSTWADQPINIGAVAGAAIASMYSADAGTKATPIAMEFNKEAGLNYRNRRDNQARIDAQKARAVGTGNFSNSAAYTDDKGRAVNFDKRSGKYLYANTNEEVAPERIRNNTFVESVRKKEQGDKRIEQSEDRMEIQRNNLALSVDKFIDKKDEDSEGKKIQLIKQVETNPIYKKAQEQLTAIDEIDVLLDDALKEGGQSLSMLGPKIAKGIAGEVGVLTEQDVTRYIENPAAVPKIADKIKKALGGKLTANSGENIKRLLQISKRAAQKRSDAVVSNLGSRYSKATKDISKKDAKEIFKKDAPAQNDQISAARKWLSANPNHPNARAVLEKLKKMEGK